MSLTANSSIAEAVAHVCRSLAEEHQHSLMDFAEFLKAREMREARDRFECVDEKAEAEWDTILSAQENGEKMQQWADECLASEVAKPFDVSKL